MPFGLHCAPATFIRMMNHLLSGYKSFVDPFLDDVPVFSEDWDDHLIHVRSVYLFERCQFVVEEFEVQICLHSDTTQGSRDWRGQDSTRSKKGRSCKELQETRVKI